MCSGSDLTLSLSCPYLGMLYLTISSVWDLNDKEAGQHCMKKVNEWKYLGDILSSNAKCDANIRERVRRGTGAALQVTQMLMTCA